MQSAHIHLIYTTVDWLHADFFSPCYFCVFLFFFIWCCFGFCYCAIHMEIIWYARWDWLKSVNGSGSHQGTQISTIIINIFRSWMYFWIKVPRMKEEKGGRWRWRIEPTHTHTHRLTLAQLMWILKCVSSKINFVKKLSQTANDVQKLTKEIFRRCQNRKSFTIISWNAFHISQQRQQRRWWWFFCYSFEPIPLICFYTNKNELLNLIKGKKDNNKRTHFFDR